MSSKPTIKENEIIAALIALIKAINPANGYYNSYTKVYDCPAFTVNDGIAVSEGDEEFIFEDSSAVFHDCRLTINIDIIDKDGSQVKAREKRNDILKAIGQDVTLGGKVSLTTYKSTINNPVDQEGHLICLRRIIIECLFRKLVWSK